MKTKALVVTFASVAVVGAGFHLNPGSAEAAKPTDVAPPSVTLAGLTWYNSLDTALAKAKAEDKPVLHLQMFGKLDDDYC